MKLRIKLVVATVALGAAGLLGVGAYAMNAVSANPASSTTLSPEASALSAMGFTTTDLAAVQTSASAGATPAAHPARRLRALRVFLRRHTLHGAVVVQTRKNGPVTIDVQRGTITSINGTTMTVKSTDGYSMTWTTTDRTRVGERGTKVNLSDLKVGENIGVAGTTTNGVVTARLVVIVAS